MERITQIIREGSIFDNGTWGKYPPPYNEAKKSKKFKLTILTKADIDSMRCSDYEFLIP